MHDIEIVYNDIMSRTIVIVLISCLFTCMIYAVRITNIFIYVNSLIF